MGISGTYSVRPVGWVREGRSDPANTDNWGDVVSTIAIEDRFADGCLSGLEDFTHAEVLFFFHLATERDGYAGTRRPRGRNDLPPVGVFAERGPRRPNRIGVTMCRIVSTSGYLLQVRGLDAVVGTPVIDIKPVMREFLPAHVDQPAWAGLLMVDYFNP